MKNKVITVFGTGFIGKNLIYQLLEKGNIVRAVSRNPYLQGKLGPMGSSSNLDICYGNIVRPQSIEKFIANSDIIINLVGVLHESGGESYHYIPCLNDSDDQIDLFAYLIKKHIQGWPL